MESSRRFNNYKQKFFLILATYIALCCLISQSIPSGFAAPSQNRRANSHQDSIERMEQPMEPLDDSEIDGEGEELDTANSSEQQQAAAAANLAEEVERYVDEEDLPPGVGQVEGGGGGGSSTAASGSGGLIGDDEQLDGEPYGIDSNIENAKIYLTPKDMTSAAGHHHHHHHYVHGKLDMGAHTGKKGSFGWHDKHPVGGKGRR